MGKYNFRTQEIAEIMSRLEALEKANNELRKENAELRKYKQLTPGRTLTCDIKNIDKAKDLLSYSAQEGELIRDERAFKSNFQVFYQNVFRALNPCVRKYNNERKSEGIRCTPINELTDEEYKIYLDTLEAVIDTIYYAKTKMKGMNDNGNANT
jgi:hypothetical protein